MMENKFDISHYDDRYFKWHRENTRKYAIDTMNWYIDQFKPKSVIDYGCGIGAYLESALNNGIGEIKGFDIGGDNVKKYTEESVLPYIEYLDCTIPLITKKYDCVISLETAEHIEPSSTDQFVENICNSSSFESTIIFSGAPPGQSGSGHINCQTKEFWIDKFSSHLFLCDNYLTNHVKENWSILNAPDYIINNLIIFKYKK
jgi:cyclopropane fatty-acyl-phospholipid synthase-like methyltransferase